MTKRMLASKIKSLRKLYAELDEISLTAKTSFGRKRAEMAADHLRCTVTLIVDVLEAEFNANTKYARL